MQTDIIRMAREAGFETANEWERHPNGFFVVVSRFAALVAAAEREACAKVFEQPQTWVCPDSAEHLYGKPGHCEDCGKTLVQIK